MVLATCNFLEIHWILEFVRALAKVPMLVPGMDTIVFAMVVVMAPANRPAVQIQYGACDGSNDGSNDDS